MLDELVGTWTATVTLPRQMGHINHVVRLLLRSDGTYIWTSPRTTEYGTWTWGRSGQARWITQRPIKSDFGTHEVRWTIHACTEHSLTLGWIDLGLGRELRGLTYLRMREPA
jgi:hypothetical protein